ncbi:hypothetical protein IU436_29355 [Nocardia farcinica]|nr:hypothetical protein [Nocardia farcinica]MBF6422719.1 hypothetical protein [Nocardia farcinica]MBF6434431.1 hypothetical protein [Nocardia farcinica]MBF6505516.1 hypothetical protein [Nocardia farcinica]
MADDARRRQQEASQRLESQRDRYGQEREQLAAAIAECVPEFVSAAEELGAKTSGLFRRYWLVHLVLPKTRGYTWGIHVLVRPDGTWRWTRGHGNGTDLRATDRLKDHEIQVVEVPRREDVRAAFISWLTAHTR